MCPAVRRRACRLISSRARRAAIASAAAARTASKPVQAGWKFCPYCAKSTDGRARQGAAASGCAPQREVAELPPARNVAEFKK